MYREVDIKEAIIAALDGKTVFGLNPISPQDIYNLTDQIATLVQDGDRFIVDEPEPVEVTPTQEVKEPETPEPEPAEIPETTETPAEAKKEKNKPGPKKGEHRKVDVGKILALHNAGWSTKQIAEEIGCSTYTVRSYLPLE